MIDFTPLREDYLAFLRTKIPQAEVAGFEPPSPHHSSLFPHQRDITEWAIRGGRRALFCQFGLGKTRMHLQIAKWIAEYTGGRYLIICPLGVRQEFTLNDGPAMGIEVKFLRTSAEVEASSNAIFCTNYESVRDGKLDLSLFAGAGLDEASVLRSYGSKTYQTFLKLFKTMQYRFVFTATPSPNRYKELIHYGAFLGIMDSGEALTRFFQRDSEQANNLTLYPHMEVQFWAWMHSWACFLTKPSDLGYSDEGYDLPPIKIHWHRIAVDHKKAWSQVDSWGQAQLLREDAQGLQESAAIKQESIGLRVSAACDLIAAEKDKHWLVWHDLENERRAIEKAIPQAKTVYGSQDLDEREELILGFSRGEYQILATKPSLAGSGCNFQKYCHNAVFLGVGYKFNDLIQAVHRVQRFQQKHEVNIHFIHLDSEDRIVAELQAKWKRHDELMERMSELLRTHKLTSTNTMELYRSLSEGENRAEIKGDRFRTIHNDTVLELMGPSIADNSVDLIHTSIPFGTQYEYSPSFNDFGHNFSNAEFFTQMGHLCPQLLRVLKPGRIAAIHVKDRIMFGNVTGFASPTVEPFSDHTVKAFTDAGFVFMARITIDTDVVRENAQTYRLGWSENAKDSSKMGAGMPEYVLIFRKLPSSLDNAYADKPVTKVSFQCQCGFGTNDKSEFKAEESKGWKCPKCQTLYLENDLDLITAPGTYSRADWQLDAAGLWRSNGDRLPDPDIMLHWSMEDIKRWWIQYSLKGGYSHEEHAAISKELEKRGKLPSSFMLFPAVSRNKDIWTDITRMRTLNSEQSRRNEEKHVCLAEGSLVLTDAGYTPIEQVKEGSLVLTHKGRWRRVLVAANTGERDVVQLHAHGVPSLVLTPEHKVWTRKSDWKRERDGAERTEPTWIRADKTTGGYINLPSLPTHSIILTLTECWLLGRFLADGHVGTRGDFYVSIGPDKVTDFEQHAGEFLGASRMLTARQYRLKNLRPIMRQALTQCGKLAHEKQVPVELLGAPFAESRQILAGYLSGDGYYLKERGRWMATSVSRALALGIAVLVQRVHGAITTIIAGRDARTMEIEGRTVNALQEWNFSFDVPSTQRRMKPFILQDGAWKKVRSVKPAGRAITWCLKVEEDESFVAEGCVVKNCPLQLDIIKRIITRYTNEGELVFDPFGGIGSVPYQALKMGRHALMTELNLDYWRASVGYCETAENEIAAPTLFDMADFGSSKPVPSAA